MTYSWVKRAWVHKEVTREVFGLTTIALAAGIPAATAKNWFRLMDVERDAHMKMPREYERALAIALDETFPRSRDQIALLLKQPRSSVVQWIVENNYRPQKSDLTLHTKFCVPYLKPQIPHYFRQENGRIELSRGRWPDSSEFEARVFEYLDDALQLILELEYSNRLEKIMSSWSGFGHMFRKSGINLSDWTTSERHFKRIPLYGPHAKRYASQTSTGYRHHLDSYKPEHKIGHLQGLDFGGELNGGTLTDLPTIKRVREIEGNLDRPDDFTRHYSLELVRLYHQLQS